MEATLQALGGIVLRGLPTFFLLLFLHFYLKRMFFTPLEKVLNARYEATTGAKKQAEQAMARAQAKAKEYEDAIRAARTGIFKQNDALRKQWRDAQAAQLSEARAKSDAIIKTSKVQLASDVASAKHSLQSESDEMAQRIVATVLRRSA